MAGPGWSFLTNHARALMFVAAKPDARLRDVADAIGVTERTAYGIVLDLAEGGYVLKERDGRRNRYVIQDHLPLRDSISRQSTVRELLDLLVEPAPGPTTASGRAPGPADPVRTTP